MANADGMMAMLHNDRLDVVVEATFDEQNIWFAVSRSKGSGRTLRNRGVAPLCTAKTAGET